MLSDTAAVLSGHGEDRARVFERFRRGSEPAASGSVLGLAIVASAARQLVARVDVSSGLGGQGVGFDVRWVAPQSPQFARAADEMQ